MSLLSQLSAEWKALRSLVGPGPLFARSHPFAHQFELPSTRFDFEAHVGDPLHNGVVAACVNAIARALPDAPLLLEQRTGAGWQSIEDHPALAVLRAPNLDHSDADVWGLTSGYKATRGQAFWLLLPNSRGEVGEIHVWNPDCVTVLGDENQFISGYRVRRENGSHFDADRSQIIHFRHLPDFHNPRIGWSPLRTGHSQIAGDNVAASYHSSILFNAGVVSLLISLKDNAAGGQVTPQQFQQVLDNIRRASRERSGGIEGINLPLEVQKLAYSPDEMSLDKLIEYYETRICSVMGVSQRVAGLGADPTYNNLGEALNDFWERRIVPDRNADAATLNRQWLPLFGLDDGQWRFRFDFSNVPALQENRDALHNRVRTDWEKGLLDKQQARALLGYGTENDGQFANVFYGERPGTQTEAKSGFEYGFKADPNWREEEHPRDERGRFSSDLILRSSDANQLLNDDGRRGSQIGEWRGSINDFALQFASYTEEHLSAYDAQGKQLVHVIGQGRTVSFPPQYMTQVRNGTITHNHPYPPTAFSTADLILAATLNLKEIKAVTVVEGQTVEITATRTQSEWTFPEYDQFKKMYDEAESQAAKSPAVKASLHEFAAIDIDSPPVIIDASFRKLNFIRNCEAMKILSEKTGSFTFSIKY